MDTQIDLFKTEISITHDVNMTWHYGIAEFYYVDDEKETCIDRAEIIEVFEVFYPDGRVEKSWTGTTVMSDEAASMHEVLARIAKDVEASGNKPLVHVRLDYDTWREIEWHWASDPEQKCAWGRSGHEL
jgi:hypothetical protein